jgi:hypothetical protein
MPPAGRSAADLHADVAESAAALAAEAASLPEAAWQASVHGIHGKAHPALVHADAAAL